MSNREKASISKQDLSTSKIVHHIIGLSLSAFCSETRELLSLQDESQHFESSEWVLPAWKLLLQGQNNESIS